MICFLVGVRAQIWDQKLRSSWQAKFEAFHSLRLEESITFRWESDPAPFDKKSHSEHPIVGD